MATIRRQPRALTAPIAWAVFPTRIASPIIALNPRLATNSIPARW